MLQAECNCSEYEYIEGVPSILNRRLRCGEIDVSPSSSIEYLRQRNIYTLVEGHSISSEGPIGSIFLSSTQPIENLEGKNILTSSQSDTSVVLLEIILRKFYKTICSLKATDEPVDSVLDRADAYLSIGDDALKVSKSGKNIYIYDLGDVWYKNTGLPFVFALWIVRKDSAFKKAQLVRRFIYDLGKAKELALKNLGKIAQALRPVLLSHYSLNLTEDELISYWKRISYDFDERHEKGLELFRKYSGELGLL